jgi:hypothetical protein
MHACRLQYRDLSVHKSIMIHERKMVEFGIDF